MAMTTSRRGALKAIGLGLGSAAIAPAVLFQACKTAADEATGLYSSLSGVQAKALRLIQDTILPKTDTPSASEMGSVEFVDTYITHGFTPRERSRLLYQLDRFAGRLQSEHGGDLDGATPEQLAAMMDTYFVNYEAPEEEGLTMEIEGNKIKKDAPAGGDNDPAAIIAKRKAAATTGEGEGDMNTHEQAEQSTYSEAVAGPDEVEINDLLTKLRYMTMESYFASEYIGEEVFNYEEVPGRWVGQMPLSELPKPGIAWSL